MQTVQTLPLWSRPYFRTALRLTTTLPNTNSGVNFAASPCAPTISVSSIPPNALMDDQNRSNFERRGGGGGRKRRFREDDDQDRRQGYTSHPQKRRFEESWSSRVRKQIFGIADSVREVNVDEIRRIGLLMSATAPSKSSRRCGGYLQKYCGQPRG